MTVTSAWRVAEALALRTPDRPPFFLGVTLHPAHALGLSPREYFARPDRIVEGQLWARRLLGHDAVTAFSGASVEVEAFGGETIWFDDGPPNAGAPPLRADDRLGALVPPAPADVPALRRVLEATERLASAVRGECPVLGAAVAPFSLPAMQLGLARWFELLHLRPELAARLLAVNEAFIVAWANAQLAAGAAAVLLFDPVASPSMVTPALFRELAGPSLRRLVAAVRGPVLLSHASAPCLANVEAGAAAGAAGFVASATEPLAAFKSACRGRVALLGGLDGLRLCAAGRAGAAEMTRRALAAGGPGGGFLLADQHGELPLQVPLDVLREVAEVARGGGARGEAPVRGS